MNSEQLKQLSIIADDVQLYANHAWIESMTGGNTKLKDGSFLMFEKYLRELNALVERFHMDNENDVTSERVQP